jgi:hypothetical protein
LINFENVNVERETIKIQMCRAVFEVCIEISDGVNLNSWGFYFIAYLSMNKKKANNCYATLVFFA